MSALNDPHVVAAEYATEVGLVARASIYQGLAGPDAREIAFRAVCETTPRRVLEVGCGWGELSARIRDEVTEELIAVDISPRMVEFSRERGVDARLGDVSALEFEDSSFDCVVANWMLYHAPDVDLALSELARVLVSGGRLVAATNSQEHLAELWSLVGRDKKWEHRHFFSEDGAALLDGHFSTVERRDVTTTMEFADREAIVGYVSSSIAHKHLAERVPLINEPLVATRRNTVFVATHPTKPG